MNNPHDVYLERSRRVASLMAWLAAALERHDERVCEYDAPATIWPMIGNLSRVEAGLKPILSFIAAVTEGEIEQSLNNEGQGDE